MTNLVTHTLWFGRPGLDFLKVVLGRYTSKEIFTGALLTDTMDNGGEYSER